VRDDREWSAGAAGVADVLHLEDGGASDELTVADAGQEGDVALGGDEAGVLGGSEDCGGQVDEFAAHPPGPGGDHDVATGPEQVTALDEDAGERFQKGLEADVGEVARVVAVAVVLLDHPLFAGLARGADLAMDARAVRGRGDHQVDQPVEGRGDQGGELAGVAAVDSSGGGGPLGVRMAEVLLGEVGPLGLVLGAQGVAAYINVGQVEMPSRAYVSAFGFKGPDQQKPAGVLSGGERNRLNLALTPKQGGNLLLLDEPTNDLDVETLSSLENALLEFPGCAVVVSHDRWFLDRVATHILAYEGESKWYWFEGNFESYEKNKVERLGADATRPHRATYKKLTRG
jgi:hypothetical protein